MIGISSHVGRAIDLPVAGVQHAAVRRLDHQRVRLRNRVRHGDEFEVERADIEGAGDGDLADRQLLGATIFSLLGPQQRRRERCGIDRCLEPRPQLDQRADMVLVRVRQDDAGQLDLLILDEPQIRQDHIDARLEVAFGKRDAEIDHDPGALVSRTRAIKIAILADLPEPAERDEHQFGRPRLAGLARGRLVVFVSHQLCLSRSNRRPMSHRHT